MTPVLLHNPRCSKSRQALALLEEKQVDFELRKYLDQPLSTQELQQLLAKLGMTARELMRKGEAVYKEEQLNNPELSEDALIQAMAEHPKLMERPVLITDDKAVVGRPPEQILDII
ncbi:arsenate reductase (glutaredoxin) [Marinospirillum perlucidum]|uniref:arsenate reductase (glutaredoxin) n=1 Tax=Marinospirillum perlucidum TaxID=1982602 RepID=UPI000DF11E74|nr:arsenate reductase (glutaredoxin) [Marinospirillum perlucidum]